jgi:structural maintenance of chromosome 4
LPDKTQVFHEQIEAKQKELQPWTAKINIKQAAIDVATSERDTLAKKATGLKDAVKQAEGQLTELQVEQEGKVCFRIRRTQKEMILMESLVE